MSKYLHGQVSFSAGEWSPRLDARIDQQKYLAATRQSQNAIAYKTGGATRRPGMQMVAPAKFANATGHNYAVRLHSFIFSPNTAFMLEFGSGYIRFYSGGAQVTVSPGSLPSWSNAQAYTVGTFVQYGGNAYYCIVAVPAALSPPPFNPAPPSDPTHWASQNTLEQPTPYNGDYGSAGPQPGTNPYGTDIWGLSFCQINDVIYITHPDYPVYSLTRYSNVDWVMQQVNFNTPALLDQNATDTQITASATTGSVTLTASAPAFVSSNYYSIGNSVEVSGVIYTCQTAYVSTSSFTNDFNSGYWLETDVFNALHVGSTWQLAYLRASAYLEVDGTASGGFSNGTSSTIQCLGNYEVHTYGVWSSDIQLQRSVDGGQTWDSVTTVSSRSDRNVDISGTAVQLGLYRFVISNSTTLVNAGATNPRVVFECVDAFLYGLVQITAFTSATAVTATVVTELTNTGPTEYWSEAAWSNYRGFPQAVTSYQQRLIYGSSGYEPQRIWGTVTDDIENFALGDQSDATDSFAFDLNAPGRGPIEWLAAQTDLFAGFSGAEWVINSGSTATSTGVSGASLTPTSINAVEHSSWGSASGVEPAIVGDALMYAQRQATSVRQMLYSIYTAKYMSQDLTALSDHLFSSGIVQMAFQNRWRKQSLFWCVTTQGIMAAMTYELDQEVFGWTPHRTGYGQVDLNGNAIANDAGFESCSVIPGQDVSGQGINDDELWVVTNRTIGGTVNRFIERMNPLNWEEIFTGAPNPPTPVLAQAYYVDCGMQVTNPGTLTIGNLAYLNGRYLVGLADGYPVGPLIVVGGSVNLPPSIPTTVGVVTLGLPISYYIQPMRMDVTQQTGPSHGIKKQISDVYVRVLNSMGGALSNGTAQYPLWISGQSYTVGTIVRSAVDGSLWENVVAGAGTIDPATGPGPWTIGASYAVAALVSYYGGVYQTFAAVTMGTVPPPADTAHWTFSYQFPWQPVPQQVYNRPVPLPYVKSINNPFAAPVLVTKPTDLRITPMLNKEIDSDPQVIIQGSDALPLTVLALVCKTDTVSTA